MRMIYVLAMNAVVCGYELGRGDKIGFAIFGALVLLDISIIKDRRKLDAKQDS